MINLFKRKSEVKTEGYPQVVKDIHNQFNLAGDKLLKQAQDIIASIRIDNKDKIDDLKNLGFKQVKEVSETEAKIKERSRNENIANLISELKVKYPQYKFITTQDALAICKKYNLVIGEVGLFKGFVPEKNLTQIKDFFVSENELNYSYTEENNYFGRSRAISVEEYNRMQQMAYDERNINHNRLGLQTVSYDYRKYDSHPSKNKKKLYIAAPVKDMDTKGYKLDGSILRKIEVPDPVVLCPYQKNGIELYCIVTAWGDEASDPLVVNETQN